MKHKTKLLTSGFDLGYLGLCLAFGVILVTSAQAQKQTEPMKFTKTKSVETQAIYKEYRGVRLGMTIDETRSKLGDPVFKSEDQDVYVFSANETTQIVYNAKHKVSCISTDYLGGAGAPDYRTVVGAELETRPNGSKYKMVRYENEGFWVSYSQSGTTVPTITVTIQAEL